MRYYRFLSSPFLFILISAVVIFHSCKEYDRSEKVTEGYIVYDIEYMDDSLNRIVKSVLPNEMKVKFKNNSIKNQMEGFSNFFNFTHIKNTNENTNTTLLTILDKKYKYTEKINDPSIFFKDRPDIQIEYTDEEKKIAGYNCKKIKIVLPGNNNDSEKFNVYYTDSILIEGFNSHTPFRSIEGVLMEFQLDFYDIPMKLKAKEVKEREIPPEEFEISDEYQPINKKTMEEIIALLK
ncbi:MAG: hypothetical protein ACLFPH_05265 [Bacteroidales bacterium]